ncbi:hypothetical protein DRF60_10935 [Chryseobacterium elymi]|uniref:Uncharacterized protein n=1 Tax=Chryseobacterium elymi TaxID=395936 RepID=A0A3D9DHK8_9FLAO|nr:hypothetical protein [Chryseobacterium elymi]REC77497.1 hypothetical protein DRF60_10935 [Chryseobacterium elymi]
MNSKLIITLTSLILCNANCTSQQKGNPDAFTSNAVQKKSKIEKIEIKEQTRGTDRLITFIPNSRTTSLNGNVSVSALSPLDWTNIIKQIEVIDLEKIASLKSPSEGRFTDRALISSISITVDGKTYESSSFDAGIPPKELENLYKELFKNIKAKQKLPKRNLH